MYCSPFLYCPSRCLGSYCKSKSLGLTCDWFHWSESPLDFVRNHLPPPPPNCNTSFWALGRSCLSFGGDGSGFWITVLVTPYNLEDSLGTAQFQFGDYLYEKYLDLNAWGMDPLTGSDKWERKKHRYLGVGFIFESFISFLKSGILVENSPSRSGGVTLPRSGNLKQLKVGFFL